MVGLGGLVVGALDGLGVGAPADTEDRVAIQLTEALGLLEDLPAQRLGPLLVRRGTARRRTGGLLSRVGRGRRLPYHDLDLAGELSRASRRVGVLEGLGGVQHPHRCQGAGCVGRLDQLPEGAPAVEALQEGFQGGIRAEAGQGRLEALPTPRVALHARCQVGEDPFRAPVGLDAVLEHSVDVGPEGLCPGVGLRGGVDAELAVRPPEALDDAGPQQVLEGEEEVPRLQHAQLEERGALVAPGTLDLLRDLGVVGAGDPTRVHQVRAEALAGQVRLGEDGHPPLEEEALAHPLPREGECPSEAGPIQVQDQAGERNLLQTTVLRNGDHRLSFRVPGGAT
jgi:hypothetical protein